jgi:hypothetical protein
MQEKLNLWDRIFNRYKTIIVEEGTERYVNTRSGVRIGDVYMRSYVKYKRIDRVTGSEKIILKYLD